MKEAKHNRGLIIAVIFMGCIILLIVAMFFLTNNKKEQKELLAIDDKLVVSLYNEVELGRSYSSPAGSYYFYSADKLVVDKMNYNFLKSMVYEQLVKEEKVVYSKKGIELPGKDFEKSFHDLFGEAIAYDTNSFLSTCGTKFDYLKDENEYFVVVDGCGATSDELYYDKMVSAYQYSDRIEIISSVAWGDSNTGTLYTGKDKTKEIGKISSENKTLEDVLKNANNSELTQYKYTYNLEKDGNYSFYSIELVK